MICSNVFEWNNFFRRRIYSRSRFEGARDDSFEMADFWRRQYIPGSAQSKWLHHGLSAEDDREVGGEGLGSQFERYGSTVTSDGTIFEGRLLWLRQAGSDQPERQTVDSCGNQGEGGLSGEVFNFCDMGGGSQGEGRRG